MAIMLIKLLADTLRRGSYDLTICPPGNHGGPAECWLVELDFWDRAADAWSRHEVMNEQLEDALVAVLQKVKAV